MKKEPQHKGNDSGGPLGLGGRPVGRFPAEDPLALFGTAFAERMLERRSDGAFNRQGSGGVTAAGEVSPAEGFREGEPNQRGQEPGHWDGDATHAQSEWEPPTEELEEEADHTAHDLDATHLLLRELGRRPLLKPDEEVALGKQLDESREKLRLLLHTLPSLQDRVLELSAEIKANQIAQRELLLPEGWERRRDMNKAKRSVTRLAKLHAARAEVTDRLRRYRGTHKVKAERDMTALREEVEKLTATLPLPETLLRQAREELRVHVANYVRSRPNSRKAAYALREALGVSARQAEGLETQVSEQEARIDDARTRFTESNLRLVAKMAYKYRGRGLPLSDLIQEGNLGLLKAIDRFDYRRGHRFSTYATWWIRQQISRALIERGPAIRIPVHMAQRLQRYLATAQQVAQEQGRRPGIKEMAREMGLDVEEIRQLRQILRKPVSLEQPLGTHGEGTVKEILPQPDEVGPHAGVMRDDLNRTVLRALRSLAPREEQVLRLRFGLGTEQELTLEEIGKRLTISRERVRQIERTALVKLSSCVDAAALKVYAENDVNAPRAN